MRKPVLGRGLGALLSETAQDIATVNSTKGQLQHLPIEQLQPGRYQPRRMFAKESLAELADSIRTQGIINPIVVRPLEKNQYEIIAGERRWRAAQLAVLSEVPVLIKHLSDETALAISLIENIQRQDLNPLEEAEGVQRLINEFQMTHQQIAEALGRSRTAISNLLRLQNLAPNVKRLLQQGCLEMGHARALLSLTEVEQMQCAEKITRKNLSVRETEALVKSFNAQKQSKQLESVPTCDPNVQRLERELSEKLGTKVYFKLRTQSKGQLVIHYNSLDELDGILTHIHA